MPRRDQAASVQSKPLRKSADGARLKEVTVPAMQLALNLEAGRGYGLLLLLLLTSGEHQSSLHGADSRSSHQSSSSLEAPLML